MAPLVTMPTGREAARAAAVTDLRQLSRALSCAVTLLARNSGSARDDAIVRAIWRSLRRVEAVLSRLPSRPGS